MKKKKNFFNLVEVALAIGVAGIGIAGVMALFPVGLNASRDAMAENYCGDAAEQLMSYISAYCKASNANWNSTIYSVGDGPPNYIPSGAGTLPLEVSKSPSYTTDLLEQAATWCTAIDGSIYCVGTGTTPANFQLFKIVRKSGNYEDFAAAVRLWKGPITKLQAEMVAAGAAATPTVVVPAGGSYRYGTALYAEVSWPMSKPYSKREKRYFYKEIFNPNP